MIPRLTATRRAVISTAALSAATGRAWAQQAGTPTAPLATLRSSGRGLPDGFAAARTGLGRPARWEVVDDPSAQDGRAVAQVEADPTDYRFPLLVWQGGPSLADLDVSVRLKAVSGRVDRAGGLAVRLADADNYLVVRANALEGNVRLYRVVRGDRQQFAGADARVSSGGWHTLALRAEGDRFAVLFDGRELFAARDRAIPGPGRVALWTKADSVTRFSDLRINPLP